MARIFKHTYTKKDRNGQRITKTARKWYIEYRDGDGIQRRVPGYVDKAATRQKAAELEREAERRESGLVDRYAEHRKRPLAEHVAEWKQSLFDKDTTERYVKLSVQRVESLLNGTNSAFWPDLDANRISANLAERREAGLSVESSNHYLRRVKQFAAWMVRSGRAGENPLTCLCLMNARTDRRHDRRAFAIEELCRLLDVASNGGVSYGVTGPERAILYRVAVETGLRASELRSLMVASFKLDDDPPTVTVAAAYSKHRREDILPLGSSLAADLLGYFHNILPTVQAFRMPSSTNLARMLRGDLEAARKEWIGQAGTEKERRDRKKSSFLAYRDDAGRVLDFHALRHTFISNLVRGGVHPKVAQQLARHSTITLTMDRYSHTVLGDLAAALEQLPDLGTDPSEKMRQRATGTLGKDAEGRPERSRGGDRRNPEKKLGVLLGVLLGGTASGTVRKESSPDGESGERQDEADARKPNNSRGLDASSHRESAPDTGRNELGVEGLEPPASGLKGRCSTN